MGLSLKKIANVATFGLGGDFVQGLWDDFTGKTAVDKQNQYNLQMWQMQNAYNTPAAQMQRYREAGLNPNLIYSQGTSGNASSAPDMLAHQGSAAKAFDLAKIALSLKNMGITNRNLEAQTKNIDAQTKQHLADVSYKDAILDFYNKHGYFPGQTNAVPNVVTEVANKAKDISPQVAHQASVAKEFIGNVWRNTVGQVGRAEELAEKAADKKGLKGEARRWYIDVFVDNYKKYH